MAGPEDQSKKAPGNSGALFCGNEDRKAPIYHIVLRPHRSLSRVGFAWLLLIFWLLLVLPIIPMLGRSVIWAILPFTLGALLALWFSINRNYRDRSLYEELSLWDDLICVYRHNPNTEDQHWTANPYWVTPAITAKNGPVENYVTLKGNGRTIELGAFLSPKERQILFDDLLKELGRVKRDH